MKFILLASGQIADRFLTDMRFEKVLREHMVGIIANEGANFECEN